MTLLGGPNSLGFDSRIRRICDPAQIRPQGQGLGWALMQMMIEYAKSEGLKTVSGDVLQENTIHAGNVPESRLRGKRPIRTSTASAT